MSNANAWTQADAWACSQLVVRLAILIDREQWSDLPTVLNRDATALAFGAELQGVDAIAAFFAERLARRGPGFRHVLAPSWLEPTPEGARAITYLTVYFGTGARREPPYATAGATMVVEYHDDFVHGPAGWRISRHETHVIMLRDEGS